MKKILIVNNNLDVGGIQKSLVNLLKSICSDYDITLLLFSKSGALLPEVPDTVKVISPSRRYCMLGLSRQELAKHPILFVWKFFLMQVTRWSSRRNAMKLLGLFQKKIHGYDIVISYSHLSGEKAFSNGCGDFVLDKTIAEKKICYIHCDYLHSGTKSEKNNAEYGEFDTIACCSDSVRARFLEGSGLQNSVTARNFYDLDMPAKAAASPFAYDSSFINLITVARLSEEKGISDVLDALHASERKDIRYYLVGDGPQRAELENKVREYHLQDQVYFCGEHSNPYGYFLGADYLVLASHHEAAPMVFDEAKVLGLPIISSDTTSARELLGENDYIFRNHTEFQNLLKSLKQNADNQIIQADNSLQYLQWNTLTGEAI